MDVFLILLLVVAWLVGGNWLLWTIWPQRNAQKLEALFRTRRPPRGTRVRRLSLHFGTGWTNNATRMPVRRAEIHAKGLSLWVATGLPFDRRTVLIPWSALGEEGSGILDVGAYPVEGGGRLTVPHGLREEVREKAGRPALGSWEALYDQTAPRTESSPPRSRASRRGASTRRRRPRTDD